MTDNYAVFGNPVAHSKSPDIHAAFARQTGQDLQYEKTRVEENRFEDDVRQFFDEGGKGLNITVPFKEKAFQLADQLSRRARQAGAVNTLFQDKNGLYGDNTDGIGLIRDICKNHGWVVKGKTVLLLGAGGAVRGVLGPLLEEQPAKVMIANRTYEKAVSLARAFSRQGDVEALSFEQVPRHAMDMIINGTSASLSGDVPPIPPTCIGNQTACYDMMYQKELTPFLQFCQQQGAEKLADGLGMLVEQAAEAFYLWRGIRPETRPVIQALRAG